MAENMLIKLKCRIRAFKAISEKWLEASPGEKAGSLAMFFIVWGGFIITSLIFPIVWLEVWLSEYMHFGEGRVTE